VLAAIVASGLLLLSLPPARTRIAIDRDEMPALI
jgi:hypothetical protein